MDIKEIKELIRALQASEIAEFTLETESVKLSIRKQTAFSAPSVMGSVSPGDGAARRCCRGASGGSGTDPR